MKAADKEAMKELLEILAVPISERINVLFGKKVGITVEEIVEMDRRQLGAALPSSGIVIEISDDSTNENASQFYMLEREAASRIVNFVMGIGASQPNPLDEIALSALKEVVSQCLSAAREELEEFYGKKIEIAVKGVYAEGSADSVLYRICSDKEKFLTVRYHMIMEDLLESDIYGIDRDSMLELLGVEAAGKTGNRIRKTKAVTVKSIQFPEFKVVREENRVNDIDESRQRLMDVSMDVSVRVGQAVCKVRDILALEQGQTLLLDKQAGAPADVVVNGALVGRADVMVSGDKFAARIIEIISKRD
ncbi:FliM/FliN family flagellar motor switch protein [Lachnospiraceae bacterium ASD3451]|uniref:FliM/FliN family flagellar motor switch protein n=1 Tax=Diplocloster agilis TaxID=2850323 RepID=UPI001DCDF3D0|nr:FliM/FliN family flagellar motor switch protein [Diplocloster agilis]MBU9744643.1 FliM/FliN family flagellar motor switch protein [Diplocloster agilis]